MACKSALQDSARVTLDSFNCFSLKDYVETLTHINQEQAWAIIFQCLKTAKACWEENRSACFCASNFSHIRIHSEGYVHRVTFFPPATDPDFQTRERATSEARLVAELGAAIYFAVDYGLPQEKEIVLNPDLNEMFNQMVPSDPANDSRDEGIDEGIEQDAGEAEDGDKTGVIDEFLQKCVDNVNAADEEKADQHYKAVCRALVAYYLDYLALRERINRGQKELNVSGLYDESNPVFNNLYSTDWGQLWVQIVDELREGVTLKKTPGTVEKRQIVHEWSPHELLMRAIQLKQYKLNKIALDDSRPIRETDDPHDVVLRFIRSRPVLKKVTDRGPPKVDMTPHDELMQAIRNASGPKSLKPTQSACQLSAVKDKEETEGSARRRLTPDPSLCTFNDDSDDDWDLESECPPPPKTSTPRSTRDEKGASKNPRPTNFVKPLIKVQSGSSSRNQNKGRRHSVETPLSVHSGTSHVPPFDQPTPSGSIIQDALMNSNVWNEFDCLALTMEEVSHIRSVITRAELDTLLFDTSLYKDVALGKCCYSCRRYKFSLFKKKYTCKLCEMNICSQCCSSMEVPIDSMQVPVWFLSPPTSGDPSPVDPNGTGGTKSLLGKLEGLYKKAPHGISGNSAGSAPNSPKLSRSNSCRSSEALAWRSKSPQMQSSGAHRDSRTEKITVCSDCQVLLKNIIQSSRNQVMKTQIATVSSAN